jgi:hypothetical protein
MTTRTPWPHVLVIVGLIAMLIGAVDPLEGSLIILPGSGLAALGALLGQSRRRRLLYWAFGLIAVGVGAMFVLSGFGGTGGSSGSSNWWLLVVLPYPVGWIIGLVGVILSLRELRVKHSEKNTAARQ